MNKFNPESEIRFMNQYEDEYERCWMTGEYDDQYCLMCPHNAECNSEEDDD